MGRVNGSMRVQREQIGLAASRLNIGKQRGRFVVDARLYVQNSWSRSSDLANQTQYPAFWPYCKCTD